MKWVLVCGILVAALAGETLAESCQTCRGVACQAKEISEKNCDEYVPALPFESQLMFNEVDDNAQYGCLDVKYYVGKSLEHIKQCVLSSDLDTYCSTLETVVAVKSCNVESTIEERKKRGAEALNIEVQADEELIEDDENETEPTDPTPDSTTNDSDALFFSVSCIAVMLLSKLF